MIWHMLGDVFRWYCVYGFGVFWMWIGVFWGCFGVFQWTRKLSLRRFGTNGIPISFKVLPMVPLVLPLVPMVPLVKTVSSQCVCSWFYQWYQWYTNIVQGFTNGTIGNTIVTNGTIGKDRW